MWATRFWGLGAVVSVAIVAGVPMSLEDGGRGDWAHGVAEAAVAGPDVNSAPWIPPNSSSPGLLPFLRVSDSCAMVCLLLPVGRRILEFIRRSKTQRLHSVKLNNLLAHLVHPCLSLSSRTPPGQSWRTLLGSGGTWMVD